CRPASLYPARQPNWPLGGQFTPAPRSDRVGRGAGSFQWRASIGAPCSRPSCRCTREGTPRPSAPPPYPPPPPQSPSRPLSPLRRPRRVGSPDPRHVLDLGICAKQVLDLGLIEVLAARDDHVLLAIDEVVEALLVATPCRRPRGGARGRLRPSCQRASSSRRSTRACAKRFLPHDPPAPRCRSHRAAWSGGSR